MIKAVLLVGGSGSRLYPLTKISNKHTLPVYNKPMVYHPIKTLVDSGIKDILLVCGGNNAGDFLRLLENGEEFGLSHLNYTYQKDASGIAHALSLAQEWAGNDPICLMLGDNILEFPFPEIIKDFDNNPTGATIFTTEVEHPEWYGVVTEENGLIKEIVEKPKNPTSNLIAIGVYLYDNTVWNYLPSLKKSNRNEFEITDLNNCYLKDNKLKAHKISGRWADCGESIDGYLNSCLMVSSF